MHLRHSLFAIPFLLTACRAEPEPLSVDAGDLDVTDAHVADSSVVASCDSIEVVSTDLEPWRVATVSWFRDQGHSGTTSERQSGDTIHLGGFSAPIDSADPQASSLAWLLALPNFPVVRAEEVEVGEFKQIFEDSATVVIMRTHVGSTPTLLFRPLASLLLTRSNDMWSVRSFRLWGSTALMGENEAQQLAACSPSAPPPTTLIQDGAYEGLTMQWCGIVGEYSYQPNALDDVAFAGPIEWVVVGSHWRARRDATLTVATENYWEDIGGADCYCGDVAGFELHVDAVSGEVLDYSPGINCVVC